MLNYEVRTKNRSAIIAFASAGVKERVVPSWLVIRACMYDNIYVFMRVLVYAYIYIYIYNMYGW
jgi:hypothetical protein